MSRKCVVYVSFVRWLSFSNTPIVRAVAAKRDADNITVKLRETRESCVLAYPDKFVVECTFFFPRVKRRYECILCRECVCVLWNTVYKRITEDPYRADKLGHVRGIRRAEGKREFLGIDSYLFPTIFLRISRKINSLQHYSYVIYFLNEINYIVAYTDLIDISKCFLCILLCVFFI